MKMPETDALSAQKPESCINRSDISRMAREAGAMFDHMTWVERDLQPVFERFAKLVAAHERQWVGLTDEERKECIDWASSLDGTTYSKDLSKMIEYKLKEKNT